MATTTTRTTATVRLDDAAARDAGLVGAKASSLARAAGAGLPVVAGFAVTTDVHRRFLACGRELPPDAAEALRRPWRELARGGEVPLVVRSSSTVEDVAASSMAGQFTSVLDVRGWEAFLAAVERVLRSADRVAGPDDVAPMAVLVQPMLAADRGGVMFGVDPVTGDPAHLVVEAVAGGPDALVSGRVAAQRYVLTRRGRLVHANGNGRRRTGSSLLDGGDLRALARLASRVATVFGGPQDVEWALDRSGSLLLLQSRPVTATGTASLATGPVLGPGPVAETFPDPLAPLEVELWLVPLRDGVVSALRESRAVTARRLSTSPVVTTVHGRVAADLELFGYVPAHRHGLALLDPRPGARRLHAAWRVGRLRAALPARTAALVAEVDAVLAAADLDAPDDELVGLLATASDLLRRLHRDEVLAGTLLAPSPVTAAQVALDVLAGAHDGARPGLPDQRPADGLLRRHPVLLALVPPVVGEPPRLPPAPTGPTSGPTSGKQLGDLGPRELLRLRARWVQELTARVAWVLGRRLADRGLVDSPASVALLDLDALASAVRDGTPPADLRTRRADDVASALSTPLPARFRLTPDGDVVPAERAGAHRGGGVGAGGGRGSGPVAHGSVRHPPSPGDVLVVRELHPGLAPYLPGLAGLVAETGGTLSHLAILAREHGVPTVVGVHDALTRFRPGHRVVVDGTTGAVDLADGPTPGGGSGA
ncbi:PEP/pyruvate-binding domain-containing protein [Thalassiella azotivora]